MPVGLCQRSHPALSPSVSPCSDIYLMEKELAKEQERNNRHRPPKIMEPPSFQEPPPKVRRGQSPCGQHRQVPLPTLTHRWVLQKWDLPSLAPTLHSSLLHSPQPSRPRYKPPPQSNLLAPKLQFQVRLRGRSIPQGPEQRGPCWKALPGARARRGSWFLGVRRAPCHHRVPPDALPAEHRTARGSALPCPARPVFQPSLGAGRGAFTPGKGSLHARLRGEKRRLRGDLINAYK